ncbi:MAG: DNA topoisomerase I [Nitrososphaeria archaeon]
MKRNWSSLIHNGIYVPEPYKARGIPLIVNGRKYYLSDEAELMALHFAAKMDKYINDDVFVKNFEKDFKKRLPPELRAYSVREMDFSEFKKELEREKLEKKNMSKEEKQKERREKERLKRMYSFAILDGKKVQLSAWRVESAGIFIGRGNHPLRGRWKPQVTQSDIVLNLSKDAPVPPGRWKAIVHRPDVLWVAYWKDKLNGKEKYVWFHESVHLMQERNKNKYDTALYLGRKIARIRKLIMAGMRSRNIRTRKIATVAYLIDTLCMRVGDEKDKDEADTVGATTLRVEHVTIENNEVRFRFLGKDSVLWEKKITNPPPEFLRNLKYFIEHSKTGQIFEGISSRAVNRFLSKAVPGLTAKVFRTYHGTLTFYSYLNNVIDSIEDEEDALFHVKVANLMAAIRLNHKRTPPANFNESLQKKIFQLYQHLTRPKKKVNDSYLKKARKLEVQISLQKLIRDYNLNTSLKNYIDPRVVIAWSRKVNMPTERVYSASLRRKFKWANKAKLGWEALQRFLEHYEPPEQDIKEILLSVARKQKLTSSPH